MKNVLLLLTLITSISLSAQQTYYWVGGPGNWSDLDEWATTSGGTERFGILPGPNDNVVFDENSFIGTKNGIRVYVDVEAEMNDLMVTNLAYEYIRLEDDNGGKLAISGDVILEDNMQIHCPMYFSSTNTSTFQNNGGEHSISLYMDGGGTLILQDSVAFGFTNLSNASIIDFNGQSASFTNAVWVYDATLTSAEAAHIHLTGNRFNTQANSTIDLPTSTIYGVDSQQLSFFGGGHAYYRLVMPNATIRNNNTIEKLSSYNGELSITNENTIDSLIVSSGNLELSDNTTNTVGYLELKGTRGEFASIIGGANQSTLDIAEEPLLSYSNFTNINITASETVVASNSLDLGNNTGFTINEITPLTYYWIGGSGDIHDLSHWATTSDGSELHEDSFSKIDNIVFDANSTNGSSVITASDEITINNFEMLGITDSIEFDIKDINIYGFINLAQTATSDLMTLRFRGTDVVATQNLGNTDDNLYSLYFYDGEHSISGDTLRAERVTIDGGHAHLSDKYIETEQLYILSGRGDFEKSTLMVDFRVVSNNEPNGSDFTDSKVVLSENKNEYSRWPYIDIKGDTVSSMVLGNEIQLLSDCSFDTLAVPAGNAVHVYGSTSIASTKIAGTGTSTVKLIGYNDAKFISREGENLDVSYTELTNLPAEGATMTADFSIDRGGNDGWTFTNEVLIPDIPAGLSTTNITHNFYKAIWNEVEGAESYVFSYTTGGGDSGTNATETTDNFFEVSGNFSEWYVAAKNEAGTSNYSERQQVTYMPSPPTIITNYIQAITASINYTRPRAFGTTAYIDLALDENFSTYVDGYQNLDVVFDNASTDNEDFIFESLEEETNYYCRVRIANEVGTSESSETLIFTTASKLTQSISFTEIPTKTIVDEPFDLEVSASSGLEVSVISSNSEVASVEGKTVTIHSLGDVTFTASQQGSEGFKSAESKMQALSIAKASQTIVFEELESKTFGDASFDLSATGGNSSSGVTYVSSNESVATISGNTIAIVGAGVTNITASQAGDDNYIAAEEVVQELIVNKADQLITFEAIGGKTFGEPSFDLTATGGASSGILIFASSDPTIATISGNTVSILGVGIVNITVSQTGDDNYNPAVDVAQELVVNKADQTITFNTLVARVFGDVDFDLTATSSSGLAISYTSSDENVAAIIDNSVTILGAGTTTITASQAGSERFLEAVAITQELVVNKASQTILFDAIAEQFVGASTELNASATSELTISYAVAGPASLDGSTLTTTDFGTVTVTASQAGNSNYLSATDVVQSFEVTEESKTSQVITFEALDARVFGEADFDLTATSSSGLAVNFISSDENVAMIVDNKLNIVGAGTTIITASQAGNEEFSTAEEITRELIIEKAEQTITILQIENKKTDDLSFNIVASVDSGLDLTYEVSGPATISGSTITLDGSEGTVTVKVSQLGGTNHNAASASVSFDVASPLAIGDELDKLKIYPNPVADYLYVELDEKVDVQIFSIDGQLVKSAEDISGKVSLADLAKGVFMINVITDSNKKLFKIIKAN